VVACSFLPDFTKITRFRRIGVFNGKHLYLVENIKIGRYMNLPWEEKNPPKQIASHSTLPEEKTTSGMSARARTSSHTARHCLRLINYFAPVQVDL
jgi:hypothetical protein